jgi:hypothetical protein
MTEEAGMTISLTRKVGLLLALAFVTSLAFAGAARAADCTTASVCFSTAESQRAAADDASNKAAWFRATSQQNFINAKQWGDKATFAFHAGNATAAIWYKAIADDYASKSVADAKAANNYANQATFLTVAADGNAARGMFIMTANASQGCPLEVADAGSQSDVIACTAGAAAHKNDCYTAKLAGDGSWGTICERDIAAVCDADKDGHQTYVDYYPVWSYQTKPSFTEYDSYGKTDGKFCHHETLSDAVAVTGVQRFRVCVQTEGCSAWKYLVDDR